MNKKSFFIICSTLIIASNLLMISVVNKGEETGGNLFVIAIACVLLPAFLYAVENRLTSMVRVESILLIQLTVISLLRLINRIGSTPEILNIISSVDVLVNNAGITQDTLMLKMTEEDFEKVLKVNLTGAFNMTQAVLKQMIKAREGAIINMSSVVGLMGNIGQANYAASKAGLIGFTKSVAREVANRNVRVNAIAPGMIESDMTAVLSDKVKDAMLAQIPMKQFGQAEQVAEVTAFLASQDYLTGQVIAIDGGLTMQ